MGAFANLHEAVFASLNGHAPLTALVGTRIYDDVPHGSEASAPAFAFVTVGDQSATEEGGDDFDLVRFVLTLHAWSRGAGRIQALRILDEIRVALHWSKSYATASGKVLDMNYQNHETLRDPDGETYHGIIRFSGLYQIG